MVNLNFDSDDDCSVDNKMSDELITDEETKHLEMFENFPLLDDEDWSKLADLFLESE